MKEKIKFAIKSINPRSKKFIGGVLFVIIIPLILLVIELKVQNSNSNNPQKYVDNPVNGMIYNGLGEKKTTGTCKDLFEVKTADGRAFCTHGPDPAPPGIDVRKRFTPPSIVKKKLTTISNKNVAGVTCNSDGQSGRRVQALYVRSSDTPDNYQSDLNYFKSRAEKIDQKIIDSGKKTGGNRNVRFVHDSNCEIIIENVVLSPAGDDTWANTVKELSSRGYNKSNRKYLIWRDTNVFCGMGTSLNDERATLDNYSNIISGYSVIDNGCWDSPDTETHELGHNLGAVQKSAPDGDGNGHSKDLNDIMYPETDKTPKSCLWDCGNNDYFSTNPEPGSYLATHWNIAYNEFLGGDEDKRPKYVPGIYSDVYVVNRQGGSGKTEIHALSGSSNFNDFSIHAVSGLHATVGKDWSFALGNFYDEDNIPDIYAINRNGGSGKTEVHVLTGKSNFSDFALQTATALDTTPGDNWVFDIGNGPDDDPRSDLFAINKQGGSGKTEVHILQGGTDKDYKDFSLHAETGLHATDKNWDFVLGGYNDNLSAGTDIYAINRRGASGKTEAHILSAESEYKEFILHAVTPLEATDNSNWSFTTGYFDNDIKADLYAINRNGASGKTEVHVLSAESGFKEFIVHSASGLEATNNSNWAFVPTQDYTNTSAPAPTEPTLPSTSPSISSGPVVSVVPSVDPVISLVPSVSPTNPIISSPPFVCGGSFDSICNPSTTVSPGPSTNPDPGISQNPGVTGEPGISPSISQTPEAPCLNPQDVGFIQKIIDWVSGFKNQISDWINSLMGNPTQNKPQFTPPCIQH